MGCKIGWGIGCLLWLRLVCAQPVLLVSASWPPFVDADLPKQGLASEIVLQAMQNAGYQTELRLESWPRAEARVKGGEAFATFPYLETAERRQVFDFSDTLLTSSGYFFYYRPMLAKVPIYRTLADLRGLRIGTARGYWYEPLFRQAGLDVRFGENEEDVLRQLVLGRVKLAPYTLEQGWYLVNQMYPAQARQFDVLPRALNEGSALRLMVSRSYPDAAIILQKFNQALAKMVASGELEAIRKRHLARLMTSPIP